MCVCVVEFLFSLLPPPGIFIGGGKDTFFFGSDTDQCSGGGGANNQWSDKKSRGGEILHSKWILRDTRIFLSMRWSQMQPAYQVWVSILYLMYPIEIWLSRWYWRFNLAPPSRYAVKWLDRAPGILNKLSWQDFSSFISPEIDQRAWVIVNNFPCFYFCFFSFTV